MLKLQIHKVFWANVWTVSRDKRTFFFFFLTKKPTLALELI